MRVIVNDELVKEVDLTVIGSFSLRGIVFGRCLKEPSFSPRTVKLVFPQTTQEWKAVNGGPKEGKVYEHNVPCLIEDMIDLQKMGIELEVETPEEG